VVSRSVRDRIQPFRPIREKAGGEAWGDGWPESVVGTGIGRESSARLAKALLRDEGSAVGKLDKETLRGHVKRRVREE